MSNVGLPTYPSPFVGRLDELARIHSLLDDPHCRLLTLVGPGGIGKTRLAAEAARLYQNKVEHGVHFVSLQPVNSSDFIVSAIADAIHLQFYPGSNSRQQLFDYFRERKLLLVLDNFEHVLDGTSIVSEILETGMNVKVIVTSRERLSLLEEWVLDVPGLLYPQRMDETQIEAYDAVRMFVEHARRVRIDFRLDDIQKKALIRICQSVGGMPLGIELAASWVRILSCEEIAAEMDRSFDILTTSIRNLPPRHRNMRAVLEHSWNLLTDDEQDVFRKLSVFRGGFGTEAAQFVAGASLSVLARLVDKSLLHVDEQKRLDIHELLRQYGEEQLEISGETDTIHDRYSAYFAAFLQQNWQPLKTGNSPHAVTAIETEFKNILAAWQVMVARGKGHEISQAIYSLSRFLFLSGRYEVAMTLFALAYNALQDVSNNERMIGQLQSQLSGLYGYLGRAEEGRLLAQNGLEIMQRVGSHEDIALAWQSVCMIHMWLDEHLMLREAAEKAVEAARRSHDRWLLGGSLWCAAAAEMELDLQRAAQLGAEGFRLAELSCDFHMRALFAGVLGNVAQREGDYEQAQRWFENGLDAYTQIKLVEGIAQSYIALGIVSGYRKHYPAAAYYYRQSLIALSEQEGFAYIRLYTLLNIANLYAAQGQKSRAVEILTLIVHHPFTNPIDRDKATRNLNLFQADMELDIFDQAQMRGMQCSLDALILEVLSQPSQIAVVPLSKRELEILSLIAEHLTNAEIAQKLFISTGTVKVHLRKIYDKLRVDNRIHAVDQARKLHLL